MKNWQLLEVLLTLFVSLPLAAQMPNWYEAASRSANYPREEWFSGFVIGEKQKSETLDAAYARIRNEARVELVSTIRISVKQTIESNTSSVLTQSTTDFDEQITEVFQSNTKISTGADDILGMQIETWQNPSDGKIAAFAFVKKATLIRQLEKRITVELAKIESSIEQASHLSSLGKTEQARELIKGTDEKFTYIETLQDLLFAVDGNADEESAQIRETKAIKQQIATTSVELENGIKIFLDCQADLFGHEYNILKDQLLGEISPMGISIVESENAADWVIIMNTNAREYNKNEIGGVTSYFAYVDVKISIEKMSIRQRVYENQFSVKGGDTRNYGQAACEAYKYLPPKIAEIIKQQIQK